MHNMEILINHLAEDRLLTLAQQMWQPILVPWHHAPGNKLKDR